MKRRTVCATALMLLGGSSQATPRRLRFALGQSWGPPFMERSGTRVLGGLLPDLMTAIAAEMGMEAEFVVLPPARVDVAMGDGTVDLQCLMSPGWWPGLEGSPRWSPPLLTLRDVLVASAEGPGDLAAYTAALASSGLSFAGVRGYRYPTLEADLAAGRLRREDTSDQWGVLEMLARSRTQLGVVKEITLTAYRARNPQARLRVLRVVEEVQGHCLVAEKPAVPAARIQAAIRRLMAKQRLNAVLEPYLGEKAPR